MTVGPVTIINSSGNEIKKTVSTKCICVAVF